MSLLLQADYANTTTPLWDPLGGADLSTWAQYPASQRVDCGGFNIVGCEGVVLSVAPITGLEFITYDSSIYATTQGSVAGTGLNLNNNQLQVADIVSAVSQLDTTSFPINNTPVIPFVVDPEAAVSIGPTHYTTVFSQTDTSQLYWKLEIQFSIEISTSYPITASPIVAGVWMTLNEQTSGTGPISGSMFNNNTPLNVFPATNAVIYDPLFYGITGTLTDIYEMNYMNLNDGSNPLGLNGGVMELDFMIQNTGSNVFNVISTTYNYQLSPVTFYQL